jgi:hypothetical protein
MYIEYIYIYIYIMIYIYPVHSGYTHIHSHQNTHTHNIHMYPDVPCYSGASCGNVFSCSIESSRCMGSYNKYKEQNDYLPLPSGWVLAADNVNSRYVIRSYNWGTERVLLDNGYQCYTKQGGFSARSRGEACHQVWLNHSDSLIYV